MEIEPFHGSFSPHEDLGLPTYLLGWVWVCVWFCVYVLCVCPGVVGLVLPRLVYPSLAVSPSVNQSTSLPTCNLQSAILMGWHPSSSPMHCCDCRTRLLTSFFFFFQGR